MNWNALVDPIPLVLHLHDPHLRIVDARFVLTDAAAADFIAKLGLWGISP